MTDTLVRTVGTDATPRFERAKAASRRLASAPSAQKNAALEAVAHAVLNGAERILPANARDLEAGRASGLSTGMQDRLTLTEARLAKLADAVLQIAALPDPVGDVVR